MLPILALCLGAGAAGGSWTALALPITGYSSDDGLGYGAAVVAIQRGADEAQRLHRLRLVAQFYRTSQGFADHFVTLDLPDLAGSGVRWDVKGGWQAWQHAFYYGRGNDLPRLREEDLPVPSWYEYGLTGGRLETHLRIPVGGRWQALAGWRYRGAVVDAYPGSLLEEEQPTGIAGGPVSLPAAGLVHDTRDQEPSPTRGHFSEGSVARAAPALGSATAWTGLNLTDRRWVTLGAGRVLALRTILEHRWGDVPFYEDWVPGGSQYVTLGGAWCWRGLDAGRYRGDTMAIVEPELRWTVRSGVVLGRPLDWMVVPFGAAGRVWRAGEEDPWYHLHAAGGVGLRFAWNEDIVVRLDAGAGLEEYLAAGASPDGPVERGVVLRFYALLDHPF